MRPIEIGGRPAGAGRRLTAEERGLLDREGYLVVVDAIAPEMLAAAREAFDAGVAAQRLDRERGTQHLELDEAAAAAWAAIVGLPLLADAVSHVLGRPSRIGVHGRNPLPGFGGQGLHADCPPRAPGTPFDVVTSLWLLDDFTPDNGATRIVPRSHRMMKPLPKAMQQPNAHHPEEIVVTAPAGAVLIFNGALLHSGTRNTSRRGRRVLQSVAVAVDAVGFSMGEIE